LAGPLATTYLILLFLLASIILIVNYIGKSLRFVRHYKVWTGFIWLRKETSGGFL